MRAGGNAVDVTIGIMFCEGVSSAQSMGLGGGFIMTIYDRKEKKAHVLDSRETAPAAANRDMFGDNKNDASLYSELLMPITNGGNTSFGILKAFLRSIPKRVLARV